MLTRLTMRQSMRRLSLAVNRLSYDDVDERIYHETYIKYNKHETSFSEYTRTFYTDDQLNHRCIRDTDCKRDTDYIRDTDCKRDTDYKRDFDCIMNTDVGGMCQKCKGSGLIYPKYRIAKGPSDYKLCEMCRGSGFR